MPSTNMKELLEAGAHFGHQTSRWHPRMKKYIFTKRNGIHIIDLDQTTGMLDRACEFVKQVIDEGGKVLFVGTKKQAQDIITEEATRCGMYYVNHRWIGGILTNFATIQARIDHLVRLEDQQSRSEFNRLPKKEALKLEEQIIKMNKTMGGFKEMTELPDALFIVDPTKDKIALAEARRVGIPVVAMVDTNCNPDEIDYPIPSNDDAMRTIKLVCNRIAESVIEARGIIEETAVAEATQAEAKEKEEETAVLEEVAEIIETEIKTEQVAEETAKPEATSEEK